MYVYIRDAPEPENFRSRYLRTGAGAGTSKKYPWYITIKKFSWLEIFNIKSLKNHTGWSKKNTHVPFWL